MTIGFVDRPTWKQQIGELLCSGLEPAELLSGAK